MGDYYGFIHLRLRKAFGSLPAIVGTAAVYSLWHVGTELPLHAEPMAALTMLFLVGVMCQSVFAITYNGLESEVEVIAAVAILLHRRSHV